MTKTVLAPVEPLRTWQAEQSWFAERTVRHAATGVVLRAKIRRNAYDDQSYGRVDALEMPEAKWNCLLTRQIQELSCGALSYQTPRSPGTDRTLDAGLDKMLAAADVILSAAIREAA
jgi:hypothetical protein